MTIAQPPSRQVRRARAGQSQAAHDQRLSQEIIAKGTAQAEAATTAAAVTKGCLTEAELQAWRTDYEARLQTIQQHPEQNLGHIEEAVAAAAREPLRLLTQRNRPATPCGGDAT